MNVITLITEAMAAGRKQVEFSFKDFPPGTGVLFDINKHFGETHEILDIRTALLERFDFQGLPFITEAGAVAHAIPRMVRDFTTNGLKPKLVVLDEFSRAHPQVQQNFNDIIEFLELNPQINVFFVKRG